jgi:hypothetical protein
MRDSAARRRSAIATTRAACAAISPGSDRFQVSVFAIGDQLGDAAHARGHRHHAARHGLQRHQAERFQLARHQQHVRQRDERSTWSCLPRNETWRSTFSSRARCSAGPRSGAVAHHQQVRRHALADLRPECERNPARASPGGNWKDESAASRRGRSTPRRRSSRRRDGRQIAVDEVLDHANLVRDAEHVHRLLAQVVADGSDAVGFLDGKLGDRKIRPDRRPPA